MQIKTMVVDVPLPEAVSDRLTAEFPEVDFVFVGDPRRADKIGVAEAYFHWNLSAETLIEAPNLRWFQSVAAGVERVLTPELLARDIIVTNNSGVHAINIAEHVLAMILGLSRQLPDLVLNQARHEWRDVDDADHSMAEYIEAAGQTLLVVGYGDIGQRLAKIASGIGMTVDAVKRTTSGESDDVSREIAPIAELGRLLGTADHVAICLPLTPETRGIFNAETIAMMKPGAFLYNIGRGQVVENAPLIAALQSGHLRGAGLDVTDPEPLPADSPLWDLKNVLITAHTSGATPQYWERASAILMTNIRRINLGETPINVVNQRLGY